MTRQNCKLKSRLKPIKMSWQNNSNENDNDDTANQDQNLKPKIIKKKY